MVPVYPSNLQQRREIMIEEYKERVRQISTDYEATPLENQYTRMPNEYAKFVDVTSTPKTPGTAQIPKLEKLFNKAKAKAKVKAKADVEEPITEEDIEVKGEGEPEDQGQGDEVKQTTDKVVTEEKQDGEKEKKRRWSLAPDGKSVLGMSSPVIWLVRCKHSPE
jgi:hypothetical protein